MKKITITHTDGTIVNLDTSRTTLHDGVLRVRTSHATSYNETWACFPLVNIRSWEYAS